MWALMASGNRRKKRTSKIAKKKLPKRRKKQQVRIKKHQIKAVRKRHNKKYKKIKPKKRKKKGLTIPERRAKAWVAWHESNDRWNIMSSAGCYGKYQLTPSYLHGDYSHKNQSKTADRYVQHRYGGWLQAKRFWQYHHWY